MTKPKISIRLFVDETLASGTHIALDEKRAHYLRHVMRSNEGDRIGAFNGVNGEWEARVEFSGKRGVTLTIGAQIAPPRHSPDITLAFAMVKNKSENIVEKATELGARAIHPIITHHSVVKAINIEKLTMTAIEAAEQCERTDVPEIIDHANLGAFLDGFPKNRTLLYGDESGGGKPLPELLPLATPITLLIGPEGGFSQDEHRMLKAAPFAQGFGMGPRILRADTAAISALAYLMAASNHWNERPHFVSVS